MNMKVTQLEKIIFQHNMESNISFNLLFENFMHVNSLLWSNPSPSPVPLSSAVPSQLHIVFPFFSLLRTLNAASIWMGIRTTTWATYQAVITKEIECLLLNIYISHLNFWTNFFFIKHTHPKLSFNEYILKFLFCFITIAWHLNTFFFC